MEIYDKIAGRLLNPVTKALCIVSFCHLNIHIIMFNYTHHSFYKLNKSLLVEDYEDTNFASVCCSVMHCGIYYIMYNAISTDL